MKITELYGQRYDVAMELFLDGSQFIYKDIVFIISEKTLFVNSFSSINISEITKENTINSIEYSKEVKSELNIKSTIFNTNTEKLKCHFSYYYDDSGKCSVLIAEEIDGIFNIKSENVI